MYNDFQFRMNTVIGDKVYIKINCKCFGDIYDNIGEMCYLFDLWEK